VNWHDGAVGFLTAGGKQLEYQCFGPPPVDAPTCVLLHEGLGCVALWRDFPAALAAATGWGVFAYSRQGYGQSDFADMPRPLDYMTREARDVLPEVLNAIGFQTGGLLGHSDGASIAAIYAGEVYDTRIKQLVLMAPHFFTEQVGLAAIAQAKRAFDDADLAVKLAKYHRDAAHTFSGWNDSWLNPDFRDWSIEHVLSGITVPVLAIQGEADPYGTLAQIDVIDAKCTALRTRLQLPSIGHAPHHEARDVVLEAVVQQFNS